MRELRRKNHFTNRGLRRQQILAKGDNNGPDDSLLYPAEQRFADRDEMVGVVAGSVPFLGWAPPYHTLENNGRQINLRLVGRISVATTTESRSEF